MSTVLLALIASACVLLAIGAAAWPQGIGARAAWGTAALCGVGVPAALWALIAPDAAAVALPLGLPGFGALLHADALSALFMLPLFVVGAASSGFAAGGPPALRDVTTPLLPAFVGAMTLTLLAADGFTLVLGFELMSLAAWVLVLTHPEDAETAPAGLLFLGMALAGGAAMVAVFALLAPGAALDTRWGFAAIRAAPPDGVRAAMVLLLVLLGAGSKAGLVPLHAWLPRAHAAAPGHVSALLSAAMTKIALYVLVRVLFDLCGPAQPVWWGLPLLAMGAASAVLGALRATQETDLKTVLAASTIEHVGLIAIGLGVALIARGADLPALAALALAAALLHALNHAAFKGTLFLGVSAIIHGAGSRRMDRLGGLLQRMPVTGLCMLAAAASLAGLPPSAGFASEWMLLQSLLAAARSGGVALQTVVAVVLTLAALALALAATAAVRLVGVVLLGRPRWPRADAAVEAPPVQRAAMAGLAGLALLLGLVPGVALLLVVPSLRLLLGVGLDGRAGLLSVGAQAGETGYAALPAAVLVALLVGGAVLAARRLAVRGEREAPTWDGGFAPPPTWLPFGDPAMQPGAVPFAQPLARLLGTSLLAARVRIERGTAEDGRPTRLSVTAADPAERLLHPWVLRVRELGSDWADRVQFMTVRRSLSLMFVALVALLAAVAVVGAVVGPVAGTP